MSAHETPNGELWIVRHGETEWSRDGRHTSHTELDLTNEGEEVAGKLADRLDGVEFDLVLSSPRLRARRTAELAGFTDVELEDDLTEWDYGDYEGIKSAEVRRLRKSRGLNEDWDIWRDGCEGGESPEDVTRRLDELIEELREKYHKGKFGRDGRPNDVLIVAHGHILRAFAARWIGKRLEENPSLILEAGGVGTLSYEHHRIEEPAILLGGAFVVDAIEKEEEGKDT